MNVNFYHHLVFEPTNNFPVGSFYLSINPNDTDFSIVANGRELDIELYQHLYDIIGDSLSNREVQIKVNKKRTVLFFFTRTIQVWIPNPNYLIPTEGMFYIPDMTTK